MCVILDYKSITFTVGDVHTWQHFPWKTQGNVCANNLFFAEVFPHLLGIFRKCLSAHPSTLQALQSRSWGCAAAWPGLWFTQIPLTQNALPAPSPALLTPPALAAACAENEFFTFFVLHEGKLPLLPGVRMDGGAGEQSPPSMQGLLPHSKGGANIWVMKSQSKTKNRTEVLFRNGGKSLILQLNQVDRESKTQVAPECWRLFHKKWLFHCLIFCLSKLENMSLKERQCHLIKKKISK